jgi:glycine cleavage system protein P-like pyridoxal-binding family
MHEPEILSEGQTIVYEELLLPKETEAQRKKNMELFCDNLELILAGDKAQSREVQGERQLAPHMRLAEATARLMSPLL